MPTDTASDQASERVSASLSVAEARSLQAFAWPDVWAANLGLEVDSHPFALEGREYQRAILRDESANIVCPKGAQLGLTTVFLLKSAHAVAKRGWSVLYLLPVKAGSVQFVQSRIDPVIDSNQSLAQEFRRVDNRNQKTTVSGARWYIRGTNIESELREVPADVLVLDERDVANEDYLADAYARLDGSRVRRAFELSTPTIEGHGVYGDSGWAASDQMQWWVACERCGTKQVIEWESNVLPFLGDTVEESKDSCRCIHCHRPFSDEDRAAMNATGEWIAANEGSDLRGYHLSQFSSPTKPLAHPRFGILVNWFRGQTDATRLRNFYNLGLGLPYAAPSDRFTVELLDSARGDYSEGVPVGASLSIGIDQGHDALHVTIWSNGRPRRLLRATVVTADAARTKWQVLAEDVLDQLSGWVAVCDAHPDKEDCAALSRRYNGRFFMGFEKDRPDQEMVANFDRVVWDEPTEVKIDRTMAFDSYIKGYLDGRTLLPREARNLGEHMPGKGYNGFYHHHLQMARVTQADSNDRLVARWINGAPSAKVRKSNSAKAGNRPDHFMHSAMFGLVASMHDAPLVIAPEVGELFSRTGGLVGARR